MTYPAILRFVLAVLLSVGLPALVLAQVSEEDDTETIASSVRPLEQENSPDLAQVARLIVQKTNAFRRNEDLEAVEPDPKLTQTAQYFADFMAKTDRYGHAADGKRPSQRATEHGYEYCLIAENIAYQFSTVGFGDEELADKFFEGWKESPPHRKNMLNSAATETGVAVAQSDQTGYFYGVQMFGRPKSAQIEFQIANRAAVELSYRLGDRTFMLRPQFTRTHLRCRPMELTFAWDDEAEKKSKAMQPKDGDKFIVTGEPGEWRVRRE